MLETRTKYGFMLIPFFVLIAAYFPVLTADQVINPDAQFILPFLAKTDGVLAYLKDLFLFKTLDFQPVRDLTFFLDLSVFYYLGIDVTVIQNLAWWLAGCWYVSKLLLNIFPKMKKNTIFFLILGFLVYPLFSQTIPWGVARKHLLSFFFTMVLTEKWTKAKSRFLLGDVCFYSFFYACSVLSQPIGILWPIWALIYLAVYEPNLLKSSTKVFLPLGIILTLLGLVNFLYYTSSTVFLENYAEKTLEAFEFSDKILALGHYSFQLVFPYLLSFNYTLGHYSTLVGLAILALIALLLRFSKAPFKKTFVWIVFSLLPLLVVMTNSRILYDTYLLIPSVGFLFLLVIFTENIPNVSEIIKNSLLVLLIVFWTLTTNRNSSLWKDELNIAKESFENRPSCMTAATYLRINYEHEKKGPISARFFLENFECKDEYGGNMLMNLYTYMFFYEIESPLEERIKRLRMLAPLNFFSHATLVSLYIREKMLPEAQLEILQLKQRWKWIKIAPEYIPIIAKYINPYCRQTNDLDCIQLIRPFITQKRKRF